MNEGEPSPTLRTTAEIFSANRPIADRGERRLLFTGHIIACPTCSDEANDLCDHGHRLLRLAIES